jgi:hypothetical protein
MTALQEWNRVLARAPQLRSTSAFVVERPDRRSESPVPIGTPQHLQTTEGLERELMRRTRERIASLNGDSILGYDAGYRPEPGEIAALRIAEIDGLEELRQLIVAGDLPAFSGDDADRRRLLLYGVSLGRADDAIVCIQRFSARQILKTDKVLYFLMQDAVYQAMTEDGFAFDLNFDLFLSGEYAFAVDHAVLHQTMGYLRDVQARAREHATALVQQLPLANAAAFIDACERDMRFARKVAGIVSRSGFARITVPELVRHATTHNIELQQENGRLVFSNATSERWVLLKLMDDDYLDSLLTGAKYEVNSKRAH